MSQRNNDGVEGEGSYTASKDYNERTRKFVDSGRVEQAARDARPNSTEEAREMKQAEEEGKRHAKDENPGIPPPKDAQAPNEQALQGRQSER